MNVMDRPDAGYMLDKSNDTLHGGGTEEGDMTRCNQALGYAINAINAEKGSA